MIFLQPTVVAAAENGNGEICGSADEMFREIPEDKFEMLMVIVVV